MTDTSHTPTDLQRAATEMVRLRDTGGLTPWSEMPRGIGKRTFTRDMASNGENVLMLVRVRLRSDNQSTGVWTVMSPLEGLNIFMVSGAVRGGSAETIHEDMMKAADDALAKLDPNNQETYTCVLSSDDRNLFWQLDVAGLSADDGVFSQDILDGACA